MEDSECSICLEDINKRKNNDFIIMILPCNHKFHLICIQEWFKMKLNCPLCRAVFHPIKKKYMFDTLFCRFVSTIVILEILLYGFMITLSYKMKSSSPLVDQANYSFINNY